MRVANDADWRSAERLAATMRALRDGRPVFGRGWRRKWRELRFLRALGRENYRAVLAAYYADAQDPELVESPRADHVAVG